MSKTGRNDICPCGSGQKYKRCCLSLDQAKHVSTDEIQSRSFERIEAWADEYLKSIDDSHPLYEVLTDYSKTYLEILMHAKSVDAEEYLKVAEPLYEQWVSGRC